MNKMSIEITKECDGYELLNISGEQINNELMNRDYICDNFEVFEESDSLCLEIIDTNKVLREDESIPLEESQNLYITRMIEILKEVFGFEYKNEFVGTLDECDLYRLFFVKDTARKISCIKAMDVDYTDDNCAYKLIKSINKIEKNNEEFSVLLISDIEMTFNCNEDFGKIGLRYETEDFINKIVNFFNDSYKIKVKEWDSGYLNIIGKAVFCMKFE